MQQAFRWHFADRHAQRRARRGFARWRSPLGRDHRGSVCRSPNSPTRRGARTRHNPSYLRHHVEPKGVDAPLLRLPHMGDQHRPSGQYGLATSRFNRIFRWHILRTRHYRATSLHIGCTVYFTAWTGKLPGRSNAPGRHCSFSSLALTCASQGVLEKRRSQSSIACFAFPFLRGIVKRRSCAV